MKRRPARILGSASLGTLACLLAQGGVPAARAESATQPDADRASASPATVRVESGGVACPSAAQVETALLHVGVSTAIADTGWVLSYGGVSSTATTPATPFVWMDLTSPTGQLIARRQLPNDDSDCGAIAAAMSAVVERSLHELGWTRGEPLPEGARATKPQAAQGEPPKPPRLILGMGPAVGTSARADLDLVLEARLQVAGPFSFRLGGGLLGRGDSQPVGAGRARVTSRHVNATILSTLPRGRLHLDAGAVFMVSIDRGKTEALAESAEGTRAALAAGVILGGGVRLSPRWRLALELQGLRAVAGGDFVVNLDDGRKTVLSPPTWQGIVCAKLEFVAWP
jgi:hypothetical protein